MLYFDHNATTPVAPEVAGAYSAALRDFVGNASSTHRMGQIARQHLETARLTIARSINASPGELVFTSGGTESNNLAILGLVRNSPTARKHVITSLLEHPSVLEPFRQLEREGTVVTYLGVSRDGVIDPHEIERNIRPETILISVMQANNETGCLQPISHITGSIRMRRNSGQEIYLHSDGVQAFGKIDVDLAQLDVDLYSISAHKVYGPKGIGVLYVRKGTPLRAIQHGGRHERDRRPGTENVPAAIAFARAVDLLETAAGTELRDRFEKQVLSALPDIEVNGSSSRRLPNTSNLLFRGCSGETLLIALDTAGFAVSTGSACSSGSIEPSHVLLAMGLSPAEARSSVRFSFGRYNTADEVDRLSNAVVESIGRLRRTKERKAHLVSH